MPNDITGINSNKSTQTDDRLTADRRVGGVKKGSEHTHTKAAGSTTSAPASSSDKVTLTGTAAKLKELEGQLANQPMVDSHRVQSVQNSLNKGEYKVDPESIADKMIDFESAFSNE